MFKPNKHILNCSILLIGIIFLLFYHFFFFFYEDHIKEKKILDLKIEFNRDLENNILSSEHAKYLKILINNYVSIEDKSIFKEKYNFAKCKYYADNLKFKNREEWTWNSEEFNAAVLGPMFFPIVVSLLKCFNKYRRK